MSKRIVFPGLAVAAAVSIIGLVAACTPDEVVYDVNAPMISVATDAPEPSPPADFLFKDVCLGQPGQTTIHRLFYYVGETRPFAIIERNITGYGTPKSCTPGDNR